MVRDPNLGPLPKFWTIGRAEVNNVQKAMKTSLSGYIGGSMTGGYWVERLNEAWRETFKVNHAIACNSATSGLWAAVRAIGLQPGDTVFVTDYSMSATAACLHGLGVNIEFIDIEGDTYCMDVMLMSVMAGEKKPKAIIVTNLFGHPAELQVMRRWCDRFGIWMIEDNAQAPWAMEDEFFAGTIGHIGVFSLNVHKHIQCGEGGVIVTNDAALADICRALINHGELVSKFVGLNLRMTEPVAAIACAQLKKGPNIVQGRVDLAHAVSECFRDCEYVLPPVTRQGCFHVYYLWAGRLVGLRHNRFKLVAALQGRGLPVRLGYSRPLHHIFGVEADCQVTETIERECLITFEVCAYDPKVRHLRKMRDIILQESDRIGGVPDHGRSDTDTVTGGVAA